MTDGAARQRTGLYPGVVLTEDAVPGYRRARHVGPLGTGEQRFAEAGAAVLDWQIQRRSGARVLADDGRGAHGRDAPPVTEGLRARLRVPMGLGIRIGAPVVVIRVLDEPDVAGFVYRARRGHPEHGEEAFLVHLDPTGAVTLEMRVLSQPAMPYRLAAPIARLVQAFFTRRYLRALLD